MRLLARALLIGFCRSRVRRAGREPESRRSDPAANRWNSRARARRCLPPAARAGRRRPRNRARGRSAQPLPRSSTWPAWPRRRAVRQGDPLHQQGASLEPADLDAIAVQGEAMVELGALARAKANCRSSRRCARGLPAAGHAVVGDQPRTDGRVGQAPLKIPRIAIRRTGLRAEFHSRDARIPRR